MQQDTEAGCDVLAVGAGNVALTAASQRGSRGPGGAGLMRSAAFGRIAGAAAAQEALARR